MTSLRITCSECGRTIVGSRQVARAAQWEPINNDTQQAIDSGPMACPECIDAVLADLDQAMRRAWGHQGEQT